MLSYSYLKSLIDHDHNMSILHSKRANIFYLEHSRVMVKDGVVTYLTQKKNNNQYFNIPTSNTTFLLLGTGTSITQSAVRMLSSAGCLIGFSGSGGTPLIAAMEIDFIMPQNEYRPTEYMQGWMSFWFDGNKRLGKAKFLQNKRIDFTKLVWSTNKEFNSYGFYIDDSDIENTLSTNIKKIKSASNIQELLSAEAILLKNYTKLQQKELKLKISVESIMIQ